MKKQISLFAVLMSLANLGFALQWVPAFPKLKFEGNPLFLTHAPDRSNRVFVVEQSGRVWSFLNDSEVENSQRHLFADLSSLVSREDPELGLLGMAFAPDFADSRLVFFAYTNQDWNLIIAKALVSATDPNRVEPRTMETILTVPKARHEANHNGGMIAFSPRDGYLYIGTGDGGGAGDPLGNSQNPASLLGKILRIDPLHPVSAQQKYAIPADNPFLAPSSDAEGSVKGRPEIFALGLRNPWRFSFDRSTGELWVGDVGQNRFEEINIVTRGGNYGWNIFEGNQKFNNPAGLAMSGFRSPIFTYGRDQGVSVTGGYVYRGNLLPELSGKYIYGDFGLGRIWALTFDGKKVTQNRQIAFAPMITSFGEDEQGELFVLTISGDIFKLSL